MLFPPTQYSVSHVDSGQEPSLHVLVRSRKQSMPHELQELHWPRPFKILSFVILKQRLTSSQITARFSINGHWARSINTGSGRCFYTISTRFWACRPTGPKSITLKETKSCLSIYWTYIRLYDNSALYLVIGNTVHYNRIWKMLFHHFHRILSMQTNLTMIRNLFKNWDKNIVIPNLHPSIWQLSSLFTDCEQGPSKQVLEAVIWPLPQDFEQTDQFVHDP